MAATIYNMPFGYVATGGTGATEVFGGKMHIKLMCFSGNTDDATCTVTSWRKYEEDIDSFKFKTNGYDLDASHHKMWFGENGSEFDHLTVNLSNSSDHLYIFVV